MLFGFQAFAQDSAFVFEKRDTSKGTKTELFVKANTWVAKTFNDAKSVIQMSDKDAGKIIAKGAMSVSRKEPFIAEYLVKFTLTIDVKDNKYRCIFSDFILVDRTCMNSHNSYDYNFDGGKPNWLVLPKKTWQDIKDKCWDETNIIASNLDTALKAKSDNW